MCTIRVNGLSDKLHDLILESNLSYRELESKTHVSKSMWQDYTWDISHPTAINLYRIGKGLGVSVDWLLGLSDKKYLNT